MDFELSEDQVALAEGIASVCAGRFDIDTVRSMITNGLDRGRWRELGQTGVFSIWLPEADGGVGLGWTDAAIVMEQLGRYLVPGPLVATTLAGGLVDGAAEGDVVVGMVERKDSAVVEFLPWLDQLLVLDDAGVSVLNAKDIDATVAAHPLDPLTPIASVTALPQGESIGGPELVTLLRRRGAMLTSALQLGLAAGATDLAVAYAKEREQFGRPIGSFQATKHRCADMAARVEVLRAAVYAAGVSLDDPETADPARAVAVARIIASHAASDCGKDCVQVHGGMGYTWEIDAHLYLKRAWVLEHSCGEADEAAELLAAAF